MTIACSKFKLHHFYCAQPKWSVLLVCTIPKGEKKKKAIKYLFTSRRLLWPLSSTFSLPEVFHMSPHEEMLFTSLKLNPLRANYCHTWHMENHPFLWRWIRRVWRIQVCMARKGLTPSDNYYNREAFSPFSFASCSLNLFCSLCWAETVTSSWDMRGRTQLMSLTRSPLVAGVSGRTAIDVGGNSH